ncbi:SAV_2336 N-terminal domain-related protein [Streptomyces sp. SD31]|uniref:SAV_2336 N-terminal domain-related protein n=1 Tax=Streptomyces sp. SD31 TaxID=3452208 RepID=UPI003F895442
MSAGGAIGRLAERLRALGAEPSARELAEALWLARHVTPVEPAARPEPPPRPRPAPADAEPPPARRPTPEQQGPAGSESDRARLYPDPTPSGPRATTPPLDDSYVRVRVPAAPALPRSLRLQRALRPLQRYHPPVRAVAHRLDEQATAERAAETGLLLPVRTPVVRRQARLLLLMDASTSTPVWDKALSELSQICAGTGAFREVLVHYVHEGPDGSLLVAPSRRPDRAPRPAEQLRDPTGHQLTLVLSDCAGPLWRDGRMQRLLHDWAQAAPVAVVQPLPQRMWQRTHLPALPGTLRRREGLGARMDFTPAHAPAGALPVPVLGLTGAAFGTWARLLSGSTGVTLPAAAAWVRADHTAAERDPAAHREPAEEPLTVFRATASHHAVELAVLLSAVPLTIPVMQLLQRAMLPATGPAVLAEVLLSGLLRRGGQDDWYEFLPGAREQLLDLLPLGDALLVLKHCGDYVDRHFGRRARNFPALAHALLTGGEPPEGAEAGVPGAFAEVSRMVVRRYGGEVAVPEERQRRTAPLEEPVTPVRCTILYAGYDRPWAAWAGRVLNSYGMEVVETRWDPGPYRDLVDALATVRDLGVTRPPAGRVLVMLSEALLQPGVRRPDEWWDALYLVGEGRPGLFALVALGMRLSEENWPGFPPALDAVGEVEAEELLLEALALDVGVAVTRRRTSATRFPRAMRVDEAQVPSRDPYFTGRGDQLHALPERLRQARRAGAVLVLSGEPGVGKTAMAVEYVHRFGDDYDEVRWTASGDHPGSVRRRSKPDSLLWVVDDWDGQDLDALTELTAHTHVLVTARAVPDSLRCRVVSVGALTRQDSVAYLMRMLRVSRGEAEAQAQACADHPAALARAVDRAPVPTAYVSPVHRLDAMTHRCVVGLSADGTAETHTGCGVLVAPGWVLTAADVLGEEDTVVVTLDDGRRLPGQLVHDTAGPVEPRPALVRLPEGVEHECVWLADPGPRPSEVLVQGLRALPMRLARWTGTGEVAEAFGPGFRVPGIDLPPSAVGGPVIDRNLGTAVGLAWLGPPGPPRSMVFASMEALRARFEASEPTARLWHDIMRAHDRYHLGRLDHAGSWPALQESLAQETGDSPAAFTPALRTRLYGIVAALTPPSGHDEARGPLALAGVEVGEAPRGWGDGLRLLAAYGRGLEVIALCAAHIWAHRLGAGHEEDHRALVELRGWTEDVAFRCLDGEARRQVLDVLDKGRSLARSDIFVELVQAPGGHGWRLCRRAGEVLRTVQESTGAWPSPLSAYRHSEFEAAVRFSEAHGERGHVVFVVPPGPLLDQPFEQWETAHERLGQRCRVSVALERENLFHQDDEASRRFRWAGVSNGPLRPLSLLHESGRDPHSELLFAPLGAVPVHCGTLSTGRGIGALEAALGNGYGLMLWRRGDGHRDCAEFHARAAELVSTAGTVANLLERVRLLRADQDNPAHAWARGLAVLYDPPLGHSLF